MPSAYGFESLRPHSIKLSHATGLLSFPADLKVCPENRAVEGPRGLYQMEGRSPPNPPGRPHSIKAQSSDGAFIVVFNEIRTGRGARGAAGTGATPAAFYLGLCRLRGTSPRLRPLCPLQAKPFPGKTLQ